MHKKVTDRSHELLIAPPCHAPAHVTLNFKTVVTKIFANALETSRLRVHLTQSHSVLIL
jgi:hypothetical protein